MATGKCLYDIRKKSAGFRLLVECANYKNCTQGWGGSLDCKLLVLQAGVPELKPQKSVLLLVWLSQVWQCACKHRSREVEAVRAMG